MKNAFDLTQYLFANPVGCFILALVIMQIWKLRKILYDAVAVVRRYVIKASKGNAISLGVLGTFLLVISQPMGDLLQALEYRVVRPVWVGQYSYLSNDDQVQVFERELIKHVTPAQFDSVRAWTIRTAANVNSTPLAIYKTAYLECGLKPFRVRDDGVAAGWIQFTARGLRGLGISLDQVKRACHQQDIHTIMALTDAYLVRKYQRSGYKPLTRDIDLYLAVFAPAHIGASDNQVVYQGYSNPAYFKNDGLDGWYIDGGKIIRSRMAKDGKITVGEIRLALANKAGRLINKY